MNATQFITRGLGAIAAVAAILVFLWSFAHGAEPKTLLELLGERQTLMEESKKNVDEINKHPAVVEFQKKQNKINARLNQLKDLIVQQAAKDAMEDKKAAAKKELEK